MLHRLAPWSPSTRGTSAKFRAAASSRGRRVWQTHCLLTQKSSLPAEWSQTLKNVYIKLTVPEGVRARDVAVDFGRRELSVKVQGDVVVQGSLEHGDGIEPDDSFWELEQLGEGERVLLLTMQKRNAASDLMGYDPWLRLFESEVADTTITHRVFFELQVGRKTFGKVVFGLYGNTVPRTVENFRALCTGEKGAGERGVPLTYKGSRILKIMPGFLIHGGDIVSNDGTSGESVYGSPFPDENFVLRHDAPGKLGMANFGINSNLSQFNIVLQAVPFLDGKHVVFGEVIHNMQLLRLLERVPTVEGDRPEVPVTISDCGELTEEEFRALVDTAGGAKEAPLPPPPTPALTKIDIGGSDWPAD